MMVTATACRRQLSNSNVSLFGVHATNGHHLLQIACTNVRSLRNFVWAVVCVSDAIAPRAYARNGRKPKRLQLENGTALPPFGRSDSQANGKRFVARALRDLRRVLRAWRSLPGQQPKCFQKFTQLLTQLIMRGQSKAPCPYHPFRGLW